MTGGEFTSVVCQTSCFIEVALAKDYPPKLKSFTGNRCEKGEAIILEAIY